MKLREALQRIADRCPVDAGNYTIGSVGDIARAALAAPVADGPVAWRYRYKDRGNWLVISEKPAFLPAIGFECEPLYTRPAPAPAERGEYPPDAVIAQCMLAVDDPLLWGRLGENSGDMMRKFARAVIDADRAQRAPLTGLTEDALMLDIDGGDPLSDELEAIWLEAMDASEKCMSPRLRGFSEWTGRTQAACKVLIQKLPALMAKVSAHGIGAKP